MVACPPTQHGRGGRPGYHSSRGGVGGGGRYKARGGGGGGGRKKDRVSAEENAVFESISAKNKIISLHSTRFGDQVVVQLKVAFDAFPTFDSHDILAGISFPPMPWPMTLSPMTEAIRVVMQKKTFVLRYKIYRHDGVVPF